MICNHRLQGNILPVTEFHPNRQMVPHVGLGTGDYGIGAIWLIHQEANSLPCLMNSIDPVSGGVEGSGKTWIPGQFQGQF